VVFRTQQTALDFLVDVADKLKQRLDDIQVTIFRGIQDYVRSSWEERIAALENRIKTSTVTQLEGGSLLTSLKTETAIKLEEPSSDQIMDTVTKLVIDKIQSEKESRKLQKWLSKLQPWRSREILREKAVLRDWKGTSSSDKPVSDQSDVVLEEERFFEKLTGIRIDALAQDSGNPEKLSHSPKDIDTGDIKEPASKEVNLLGFLIRAPVFATATKCSITVTIWPFLAKSRVKLPIRLTISDAIATYQTYTMEAWNSAIEDECRRRLEEAINFSSRLGMKAVIEAIRERQTVLSDNAKKCAEPLPQDMEEDLIFMHASSLGALAAVEELLKQMPPEVLSAADKSAPTST
jgi:hypothetical protein